MSAFLLTYDPVKPLPKPKSLDEAMKRLSHRGPDGKKLVFKNHALLAHWHFWTVPEEVGEEQPLQLNGLPYTIVFDGRLDNRTELFTALDIKDQSISDAALTLYAYRRWGADAVTHFLGEFAFAIFDEKKNELFCARDHLGDRTLFYAQKGSQTLIASEPWAVVALLDEKPSINERAVAHYFAFRVPEDGQSFFDDIYELLPAHTMLISAVKNEKTRYWQPDPNKKIRYKTDEEYAEHFLSLLEESVRARMRSTSPVGVMMSGGLDSTSVASLAARMIAPERLTTISYVFDDFPECDEREYINAVKEKWNINSIQFLADDLYPYKKWQNWSHGPNQPEPSAYTPLRTEVYKQAQRTGIRTFLTGDFGNHIYDGEEDWLLSLVQDDKFRDAIAETFFNIRHFGLVSVFKAGSTRKFIKNLLGFAFPDFLTSKKILAYPWLEDFSQKKLENNFSWIHPAFISKKNMLDVFTAYAVTAELRNPSSYHVDLRFPYRDRRLIEFILAIPAHQIYKHGEYKYIVRMAMRGILPENVRKRKDFTSLISFYNYGFLKEKTAIEQHVINEKASWRKYLKKDWLYQNWDKTITRENDGTAAVVPWRSFSYDLWQKKWRFYEHTCH